MASTKIPNLVKNPHQEWSPTWMHWIHIQTEYITKISSEMNLKFGKYWEISEKDLLKLCKKLENTVKIVVWKENCFL